MSETITLGKSRKDGKWLVLVQPERPFGEHLAAYRKIAVSSPVNDEFSRVVIGKIHHSSPALTLVSTEQAAENKKQNIARHQSVAEIVKSADDRQAAVDKQRSEEAAEEHALEVEEKNSMVNKVLRETGQEIPKPATVKKAEAKQ